MLREDGTWIGGLTPAARQIMESVPREANQLNSSAIEPEHMLLALLSHPDDLVLPLLTLPSAHSLEHLRAEVLAEVGKSPSRDVG